MTASNVIKMPALQTRLPMSQSAVDRGITPEAWRVLVETTFPSAKTAEAVEMAFDYCKVRGLDIFKKPVHIVPMWNSALRRETETIWVGINEIQITAHRTGQFAGMDSAKWGPLVTKTFSGQKKNYGNMENVSIELTYPEWCEVVVYRLVGGQPRPFSEQVFWEEAYSTSGGRGSTLPNDMWVKRPRGQLLKVAKSASLRAAFPEEADYTAEEMEGKVIEAGGAVIDHQPVAGQIEHNADPVEPEMTREEIEKFEKHVTAELSKVAEVSGLDDLWRSGINARLRDVGAVDKKAQSRMISAFSQRKKSILDAQEADQEGDDQSDAIPAAVEQEAPQKPAQADPEPAAVKPRDQIDNALDALRKGDDEQPVSGKTAAPIAITIQKNEDGSPNWSGFFNAAKAQIIKATDDEYGDAWLVAWKDANEDGMAGLFQAHQKAFDKITAMYKQSLDYQKTQREEAEAEALTEFPTIEVTYQGDSPDWLAFLRNLHGYLGDTPNHRVARAWWTRHSFQVGIIAKTDEVEPGVSGKAAAAEFKDALFARFPQLAD